MNLQAIALWVGIAGGFAGIGFPAYQTHKADQAELASERQQAVERAKREQMEHDRLWQTLNDYQRHFQLLDENLPAQQRRIARAIFTQMQVQQQTQVLYDKAMPVLEERRMKPMPVIAADAPSERTPQ